MKDLLGQLCSSGLELLGLLATKVKMSKFLTGFSSSDPEFEDTERLHDAENCSAMMNDAVVTGIKASSFYGSPSPNRPFFQVSSTKTYAMSKPTRLSDSLREISSPKNHHKRFSLASVDSPMSKLAQINSQSFRSTSLKSYEVGFPNSGLTCYSNSVLQGLLGIPDFVQDLIKLNEKLVGFPEDDDFSQKPNLLRSFCKLAISKENGLEEDVKKALQTLRSALIIKHPQFQSDQMQDAHEFLITFCNTLSEEGLNFQKKIKECSLFDPILKHFGFKIEETRTCRFCSHTTVSATSDFILKLSPPSRATGFRLERANNMVSMIKRSMSTVHEIDCVKCKTKGEVTVHTITEKLKKFPKYFIFYLPRTRFVESSIFERFEKNREEVLIPEILNLGEFASVELERDVHVHKSDWVFEDQNAKKPLKRRMDSSKDGPELCSPPKKRCLSEASKTNLSFSIATGEPGFVESSLDLKCQKDFSQSGAMDISFNLGRPHSDSSFVKFNSKPFLGTKSNTSFDKFSFTVNRNEDTKTKIIQRENSDVGSLSEADQIELALKNSVKDTDEIPVFCDESLKDCTSMNFQNGTTGSPSGGKKVTSLKNSAMEPQNYRLTGVVSHLGTTANVDTGHYVADVFSHSSKRWYRYDDMKVTPLTLKQVIEQNSKDGYIFIYQIVN